MYVMNTLPRNERLCSSGERSSRVFPIVETWAKRLKTDRTPFTMFAWNYQSNTHYIEWNYQSNTHYIEWNYFSKTVSHKLKN